MQTELRWVADAQIADRRVALWFGAVLPTLASAVIHLAVAPEHLKEYWMLGWFFIAVGTAQIVWAALAVRAGSRWVLWAGAFMNEALIGLWIGSRTVGTPVGPMAGIPERVGPLDSLSTLLEIAAAGVAMWIIWSRWRRRSYSS